MKIINVIENEAVIKKILKHVDLWDDKARPPPKHKKSSKMAEPIIDYSARLGATPLWAARHRVNQVWAREPQIQPSDDYLYFDVESPEVSSGEFSKEKWRQPE